MRGGKKKRPPFSRVRRTTVRYLECHTAHPTTVCENYCCHLPSALFLLCSGISVPIYLFPCTYTRAHIENRDVHTHHTHSQPGVGIIASEHARSNFRSAFLALSTRSLPLYTLPSPRLLNHFLLCPSYLHVLSP